MKMTTMKTKALPSFSLSALDEYLDYTGHEDPETTINQGVQDDDWENFYLRTGSY